LLVERAENALFEIHRELGRSFPGVELVPLLVDITERERLRNVFASHHPDLVVHAAAHKHVPMLEWNPSAAIENNVGGTRCVAELAREFEARQFVMVSTDKAVRPRSIMGASKRCAELLVQDLAAHSSATRFVIVRFGNVLGSNGSVVPIFKQQIAQFGPVTVTHPHMERYFMTIPEASQLVLQAATMGDGGEIFVLDMGEPVRIVDLANDLIRLSGLIPGEDVAIEFTGLRPGEKLKEELCGSAGLDPSDHPAILVERERGDDRLSPELFAAKLRELLDAAEQHDEAAVRAALARILPTAQLER
ncbi:MAG TPA: polysaccharide biosynthesis protein, partial [Enhygromyxa sp.]|nr:polysaccharide biosynthesis protein [Enhygromyxa sp.]